MYIYNSDNYRSAKASDFENAFLRSFYVFRCKLCCNLSQFAADLNFLSYDLFKIQGRTATGRVHVLLDWWRWFGE